MKMKLNEALEIFGLDKSEVTAEAVKKRYKDLMKQVHGDKGGSDYFAKQVNGARDVLSEYAAGTYSQEQDNQKKEEPAAADDYEFTQEQKDAFMDEVVNVWAESKTLKFKVLKLFRGIQSNETALLYLDHAFRLAVLLTVLYGLNSGFNAFLDLRS